MSKGDFEGQFVITLIAQYLQSIGFKRIDRNWRRYFPQIVQVVNLQSAGYAAQYYVNLGLLLRAINDQPRPKHWECQIRARLERLSPDTPKSLIEQALCFTDNSLAGQERTSILTKAISGPVVRFFESAKDEAGARKVISSQEFDLLLVDRLGADYLHLQQS